MPLFSGMPVRYKADPALGDWQVCWLDAGRPGPGCAWLLSVHEGVRREVAPSCGVSLANTGGVAASGRLPAAVTRVSLHATARASMDRAVLGMGRARARRAAEREEVWTTLERFELVTRSRGSVPLHALHAGGIT